MANVYPWTNYSSSSTTGYVLTTGTNVLGTTWDQSSSAPRAVEWNGAVLRVGPPASAPDPVEEGPLDWLRRRVDECQVDLAA